MDTLHPPEIHENLTICHLIPHEADQGWKMELFDLGRPAPTHYHKIQRQYILVLEGEIEAQSGGEGSLLANSDLLRIDAGILHSLVPKGRCRFLSIDMPSIVNDVFFDKPQPGLAESWSSIPSQISLEKKYYSAKYESDTHTVYDLINGQATQGKWSAALIEIQDVPNHYHKIEKEHFIVIQGKLHVEVDGKIQILEAGESITFLPSQAHRLKSAESHPAKVLCFNFPAFDPSDMYFN